MPSISDHERLFQETTDWLNGMSRPDVEWASGRQVEPRIAPKPEPVSGPASRREPDGGDDRGESGMRGAPGDRSAQWCGSHRRATRQRRTVVKDQPVWRKLPLAVAGPVLLAGFLAGLWRPSEPTADTGRHGIIRRYGGGRGSAPGSDGSDRSASCRGPGAGRQSGRRQAGCVWADGREPGDVAKTRLADRPCLARRPGRRHPRRDASAARVDCRSPCPRRQPRPASARSGRDGAAEGPQGAGPGESPLPSDPPGPGQVVLTTVHHLNRYLFELRLEDEHGRQTTVRPTGFHKFYSADRRAWVSADSRRSLGWAVDVAPQPAGAALAPKRLPHRLTQTHPLSSLLSGHGDEEAACDLLLILEKS